MATDAAFDALEEYLEANWTSTEMVWENESYDPTETQSPWVRVEITSSVYQQESIGAGEPMDNRWVESGIIFFHVLVPTGTGTRVARQHATALIDLFRGLDLDDFEFLRMSVGLGRVGTDDGNWWVLPAEVEWIKG